MPPRPVICVSCNKPIAHRSDLIVYGRSFRASHTACFTTKRSFFEMPLNGAGFWRAAAWINGMILIAFLASGNRNGEGTRLFLTFNAALAITRLISYLAYERRLT